MKSKENYTPKEVVLMAKEYHRIKSASLCANPLIEKNSVGVYHFIHTYLPRFRINISENVRKEMKDISSLIELIEKTRR